MKSVLEEFVPSAVDAIEVAKGRVVLVDGTLTLCWSYEEHHELWNKKHKTTGFNAQLISLLDGSAVWISGPLPGKTHDAKAFKETGAADILKEAGGGFGDKGYQGTGLVTPKKKPKGGELTLSDKEYNSQISSFRGSYSASVSGLSLVTGSQFGLARAGHAATRRRGGWLAGRDGMIACCARCSLG